MKIWKLVGVAALGLTSFAADNVAPTKAELEEMYNTAYRAFDAGKFPEALKQLDAIDARQPDLAASKNLRGVILMRQGNYDQSEAALTEAARIDPKFWNARFNLAEIPFLKKDWAEARKRFEQLLSTGKSDLAKEASQLIQYKILLTYLMEGQSNMVDSILAKLELSPDTPAVDYVKAAVALQQKNESEAKDWISAAEKNYSPQLNKLFVESLYEIGSMEKPQGQRRASLPLMTAAERTEKTKAFARSKFEQSQQAFRQRDFATALKLVDEADKIDPNQPATLNLRGEILMQQSKFDDAETAFKKAAKLDPKLRDAQYNLAQIPFKKKEYAKARDRFDTLYKRIPGGDKNQAAELIKFKIYMTYLMEGKESMAHSMMEEFQFTGDTPALYYAQAAWEYKHNNAQKGEDWTNSANKIYSPALNGVFADAFYDVGWLQRPEGTAAPAVPFDTTNVASQAEGGPAVEPSPIPDRVFAASEPGEASNGEPLALAQAVQGQNTGMELASAHEIAKQPTTFGSSAPAEETSPAPEQPGSKSPAVGGDSTTASKAVGAETSQASPASNDQNNQQAVGQPRPSGKSAVEQAPAKGLTSVSGITDTLFAASRRTWIVGGLLLAGIFLLAWVIVPVVRRHAFNVPRHLRLEPPPRAAAATVAAIKPRVVPSPTSSVQGNGFVGGPRQISVRLTASAPFSRSGSYVPDATGIRTLTQFKSTLAAPRGEPGALPLAAEEAATSATEPVDAMTELPALEQVSPQVPPPTEEPGALPLAAEEAATSATEPVDAMTELPALEQVSPQVPPPSEEPSVLPLVAEEAATSATEPVDAMTELPALEQVSPQMPPPTEEPSVVLPLAAEVVSTPATEPVAAGSTEPLAQVRAYRTEPSTAEAVHEAQHHVATGIRDQPASSQTAMPETTHTPLAPIIKAPVPPVAGPQLPPGTMHTVEVTFCFEVASVQLTPAFKVGALQVRPTSKTVILRLAPSQDSQPKTDSDVVFELANVGLAGDALGKIQVIRSQQQKPLAAGSPSFAVAGLQFVPSNSAAPIWLSHSQQGRPSIELKGTFQISAIQFSPSFEVASVILNPSSKRVRVQLPVGNSGTADGASVFEIANVQLTEGGDIRMMHLNLLG
jgi:Flp pilus assembly protein TadD